MLGIRKHGYCLTQIKERAESWFCPSHKAVCVASATKPDPAVDKPESYSDRIHDHFTFGSLFVLLFQKLQAAVQLDNLWKKRKEDISKSLIQKWHPKFHLVL